MRDTEIDIEEAVMADWEKEEIEKALKSLTEVEKYLVYKVIGKNYPLTSVAIDLNKLSIFLLPLKSLVPFQSLLFPNPPLLLLLCLFPYLSFFFSPFFWLFANSSAT